MALREIIHEGAPVLTALAQPVTSFDDRLATLVRDMFETMYDAPGRGLAAPQVGAGLRVFVVDTDWKEADPAPMIFVNPQITAQSATQVLGVEACLSIPDKSFNVTRPDWVQVTWQDLDGAPHRGRFEGLQARCILHENDHLDGILISMDGKLI